jgi:hypothetical protein
MRPRWARVARVLLFFILAVDVASGEAANVDGVSGCLSKVRFAGFAALP